MIQGRGGAGGGEDPLMDSSALVERNGREVTDRRALVRGDRTCGESRVWGSGNPFATLPD